MGKPVFAQRVFAQAALENNPHSARQTLWRILAVGSSLLLAACGGLVVEQQDSAPDRQVDVSTINNPVPRAEPFSKYGNPPSYVVYGRRYHVLDSATGYEETGVASWYGTKFHGRRTSSGEPYDMYAMTAAHKTLPIPVYAEITNLDNGRKIIVRINDRGPFVDDRIIDLSYVAAIKLGINARGTGHVHLRVIDPSQPQEPETRVATAPAVGTAASPVVSQEPLQEQQPVTSGVATISPIATANAASIESLPVLETAPLEGAALSNGLRYVQVGAFSDKGNASQLAAKLTANTNENVFINRILAGEQDVYRVRIGPLNTDAELGQVQAQLEKLGIRASHIVLE